MSIGNKLELSEYEKIENFIIRFSETENREFQAKYWGIKKVRVSEIEPKFIPYLFDDSTIFLVTHMNQDELMWLEKNSINFKQLSRANIMVEVNDKRFQCQFDRIYPSVILIGEFFDGNVIFQTTPLRM